MNIDMIYDRLEAAGYQGVTDLVIEKCMVDMNAHGDPFYAREHRMSYLAMDIGRPLLGQGWTIC